VADREGGVAVGKNLDPFFDREEIENMPTEDQLKFLRENREAVEQWDEENPDPER
jgi:hypothetical protein